MKGVWPEEQPRRPGPGERVGAVAGSAAAGVRTRPWLLLSLAVLIAFGVAFAATRSPSSSSPHHPTAQRQVSTTASTPALAPKHHARPRLEAVAPVKAPPALASTGKTVASTASSILADEGVSVTPVTVSPTLPSGASVSGTTGSSGSASPGTSGSSGSASTGSPSGGVAPGTGLTGAASVTLPGTGIFTGGG